MDSFNSFSASFSKFVRELNGLASIEPIGIKATPPVLAVGVAVAVISVEELSNKAPNPFPKAERFFGLDVISYLKLFVVITDFCQIVSLKNFTCEIQIIDSTFTGSFVHDDRFPETWSFSQFRISMDYGIKNQ